MQISVFGATGQIGAAITVALARQGHEVRAVVRRRDPDLPDAVEQRLEPVFNKRALAEGLGGCDMALYAVGLAEQWVADEGIFHRVNVELFDSFLRALAEAETPALMYVSTYEVFAEVEGLIREANPLASPEGFSPYYRSMLAAYRMACDFGDANPVRLITLHPAAAYGGRNTGRGVTDYIENLARRRFWRVPFVPPSQFPVVHVESLAAAAVRALEKKGPYIISDGMTSLKSLAELVRSHGEGFVPPTAPLRLVRVAASLMEAGSRLTGRPPLMAHVQLDYLTAGHRPAADKARAELDWQPLPVERGVGRYLRARGGRSPSPQY